MPGDAQLGRVLRALRQERGISLKTAAEALGTDRHATISEIEGGRRKVSFSEMSKLAKLYGVTLADVSSAMEGAALAREVSVALPRAQGDIDEAGRLALARLERLARDYASVKQVLAE